MGPSRSVRVAATSTGLLSGRAPPQRAPIPLGFGPEGGAPLRPAAAAVGGWQTVGASGGALALSWFAGRSAPSDAHRTQCAQLAAHLLADCRARLGPPLLEAKLQDAAGRVLAGELQNLAAELLAGGYLGQQGVGACGG